MNLNSRKSLIQRLQRGKAARNQFIDSHLNKAIAHQIRATRDKLGWSQEQLAAKVGMNQNAISRLESSGYGRPTITTLKRLAATLDVGLVVRFVPFSEMVDWISGVPRRIDGLTTTALAVPNFEQEVAAGVFDSLERASSRAHDLGFPGIGRATGAVGAEDQSAINISVPSNKGMAEVERIPPGASSSMMQATYQRVGA